MIVRCSECNSAYQVDDEKVQNKRFAFTCPKCKAHVIVDNRAEGYDASFDDMMLAQDTGKPHTINEPVDTLIDERGSAKRFSEDTIAQTDDDLLADIEKFEDFDKTSKIKKETDAFAPIESERESESIDLSDFSAEELARATDDLNISQEVLESDIVLEGDIKSDEIFSKEKDLDESITIDLDTLDIPIEESTVIEQAEMPLTEPDILEKGELPEEEIGFDDILVSEEPARKPKTTISPMGKEKEKLDDITLDLDSLDIQLDEHAETLPGEQIIDEDEKLTLEDAGITIDELIEEQKKETIEEEEELKLSLDEIEPGLTADDLHKELTESELETIIASEENFDTYAIKDEMELPEVDLDKYEMGAGEVEQQKAEYHHAENEDFDSVPAGFVNLTIDYSLSYSRSNAILRLLVVYLLSLLPHILVCAVYSIVSMVLGFFNWVVILFTGQFIDDFADIQQNTLRYWLSIVACAAQITEDRPVYAGRPLVEHSLQLDVVYPSSPSRLLALLRISLIGIIIALLPHLLLYIILTMGVLLLVPIGLMSIVAIKHWPTLLFDFMYRYMRYAARIWAYAAGLVDKYPSFIF